MTLTGSARRTLVTWSPPTGPPEERARQEQLRDAFVRFLDAHPDATSRACRAGHLTASALVVAPERGEALLTRHAQVGRWLQLGGHCEPSDPDLAAAALREAREESGIVGLDLAPGPVHLDRHAVRCRFAGGTDELDHLDVQYVAVAPPGAVARAEGDAPLRWFAWDALPDDADDAVRALVRLARRSVVE